MTTCATVMKSLLVVAIVVAMTGQGSAVEKFSECCTKVAREEITEPILAFMLQKRNHHCVKAVIFQTETGFYCSKHDEPWVRRKIQEFRKSRIATSAPTTSLLKLITSSSSPPSTPPPSPTLERTTGMPSTQHTVQ